MKVSLCQIIAIVLTVGLVFTSGIAPTLNLAYAHSFETIQSWEVIREDPIFSKTTTTTDDVTVVTEKLVGVKKVYGYVDKTVPVGAHNHWYDYVISVAIAATPAVIALLASD